MHEGALLRSLFDVAIVSCREANLTQVHKVKLVIGKLHHVVFEVMQMYFAAMRSEYAGFQGAVLEIEEYDPVIKCNECGKKITLKEPVFICPECSSPHTECIRGKEMYIDSLEGE